MMLLSKLIFSLKEQNIGFFILSQCSVKNIPVCFSGDEGAVPSFATIVIERKIAEAKNLKVFIKL